MQIGFIGLGNMGRRMVPHLMRAGYTVRVHDAVRGAGEALVAQGAEWAEHPREAAAGAEVVCLSLPGPKEVAAVWEGPEGVLAGIGEGALVIDLTTNSPSLVRRLQAEAAARGADLVDAPVSGGIKGADAASLTILLGGSEGAVARARPVLEKLGQNLLHVGEVGAGSVCKVTHNCAVFSTNLAMVECLTLGIRAGVEAKVLVDVFQKSGIGKNLDLQVALPATLFQGNFNARYALRLAHKDMKLATDLARELGLELPLGFVTEGDLEEAMERGWGELDNNAFLRVQEERAGVEVRI